MFSALQYKDLIEHYSTRETTQIAHLDAVHTEHTNRPGRPSAAINPEYLREATSSSRSIPMKQLSRILGVHRNTLRKKIRQCGLPSRRSFDNLSDAQLDTIVKAYKLVKPNSGLRYVRGFLRSQGLRIQKSRVMHSLRRVDALGQVLRRRNTIKRRKYCNPRPNAVWHCDGHHKLIWWGIVFHGFVDGYCRTVSHEIFSFYW
jgi:hypothetical protein